MTPEEATNSLFQNPRAEVDFVAKSEEEARRAVEELARLYEAIPGVLKVAIDGAAAGAETLSADKFQGLSEIIQNADDVNASFVEFRIVDRHLLAVHDGRPVSLSNVLGLATPWHSTKTADASATGRFGIGLMTLRALGDEFEVHSGLYHLRFGHSVVGWATNDSSTLRRLEGGNTAIRIPLRDKEIDLDSVVEWFSRWDSSALLFLRNVQRVTVLDSDGADAVDLRLGWSEQDLAGVPRRPNGLDLIARVATAPDGRQWLVHTAERTRPQGVARAHKATEATVTLGLALPLQPESTGVLHAGLPVVSTAVPVRINAPFDPVTGRTDLADNKWNNALLPLIANLWAAAVAGLFRLNPVAAWHIVPLPRNADVSQRSVAFQLEEALLAQARERVAKDAAIDIDGQLISLASLAVEEESLEGVLAADEVAALAGLDQALPMSARDAAGSWRHVLSDWMQGGADLPVWVTVQDALPLLAEARRGSAATIALTAVAIAEQLEYLLVGLPCVVTADGEHVIPPAPDSLELLLLVESSLASQLRLGTRLAHEYAAETDDAIAVIDWLRDIDAVVDDPRDETILRRLAAAGEADHCMAEELSDDQLRALRGAFETLPADDREIIGRRVGRAIRIAAYSYDERGRSVSSHARPVDMYLSAAIERDSMSFGTAADRTPGLLWTANRYRTVLAGAGVGAQRFLGMLGVERTPRFTPHPELSRRYAVGPRGLRADLWTGPAARIQALRRIEATFTLDDVDSPDLCAVVRSIAAERKKIRRRERTRALLATLGRAWDKLDDKWEVAAAWDYSGWVHRENVPAFWLWRVREVEWLEDADGMLRAPVNIRLKTPATVAVHGPGASGYLHKDLDVANRRDVLARLGVAGEPSTNDLIERLRSLRNTPPDAGSNTAIDAAIVYQALAQKITGGPNGRAAERRIREAFDTDDASLILTSNGWRRPTDTFAGPPVFGPYGDFVPQVPGLEALWTALKVRAPAAEDCVRVIRSIAGKGKPAHSGDKAVVLDTLRLLDRLIADLDEVPTKLARALRRLPVLTTMGWTQERPVFATDDSALVDGLREQVPIWAPGGQVSQFESSMPHLAVVRLADDSAVITDTEGAEFDPAATELFAHAVALLEEDLARNDPNALQALRLDWKRLRAFEVRVHLELYVTIDGLAGRKNSVTFGVPARADTSVDALYLRDPRALRTVEAGGAAIARLFVGIDRRRLSQAWLAACIYAEEGRAVERLELASHRAELERVGSEVAIAQRRSELAREIEDRQSSKSRKPGQTAGSRDDTATDQPDKRQKPTRKRELVDPSHLTVVSIEPSSTPRHAGREAGRSRSVPVSPTAPDLSVSPLKSQTPAATFTAIEKETKGLELLRRVLVSDEREIIDLRAQRNVGADAIDERGRLWELKVSLGEEPDVVSLQASQVEQALQAGADFFLVVVSNVERSGNDPQVRIIIDPLHQLRMAESSQVTLAGVREAPNSLVYRFRDSGGR